MAEIDSQTIIDRRAKLFALGMARTHAGFQFHEIAIDLQTVNELPNEEWVETLEQLTISVENKKKGIVAIVKTDREKLEDFIKSLGHITGPELREKESQDILDGALILIRATREYITDRLEKMEAEK